MIRGTWSLKKRGMRKRQNTPQLSVIYSFTFVVFKIICAVKSSTVVAGYSLAVPKVEIKMLRSI